MNRTVAMPVAKCQVLTTKKVMDKHFPFPPLLPTQGGLALGPAGSQPWGWKGLRLEGVGLGTMSLVEFPAPPF